MPDINLKVPAQNHIEPVGPGPQIRELRKLRRLVLKDLAGLADCSVGYLSQVERGLSEISITHLSRIAQALGVPLAWFFQPQSEPNLDPSRQYVVRGDQRRKLSYTGSGVQEEMLSPSMRGESLIILTRTEPGANGGEAISRSVEESGLVLAGELELSIDGRWLHLDTGDSFQIPRGISHEFRNPGRVMSEVVWFITPANY